MEEEETSLSSTTVICSLNRLLNTQKYKGIKKNIDDFVRRTTISTFLASALINAHLLRLAKKGEFPVITQTLCFRAQLLVSDENQNPRKINSQWKELQSTFESLGIKKIVSGKGLSQIRASVGIQMVTDYKNYNEDALKAHQRRYLEAKYGLSRTDSLWLVNRIRSPIYQISTVTEKRVKHMKKKYKWSKEELIKKYESEWKEFGPVRAAISASKKVNGGSKEAKKEAAEKVQKEKAKLRFEMLKTIEEKDPNSEKFRRFTLFPVNSLKRKFIRIDKKALQSLYPLPRKKKGEPPKKKLTIPDVFKVANMRNFNSPQWENDIKSIVTNGYQAHSTWRESKNRKIKKNKDTFQDKKDAGIKFEHIRGVDPGNASLVVCSRQLEAGKKPQIFSVSKKQYYENCGTTRTNRMILRAKKRTDHGKRVVEYESEWAKSTIKTTSWEKMKTAVQSRFKRALAVASFYFLRKWASRRFLCAQKKSKELCRIAREITTGVKYVSFGDGSFRAGIKGCSPGGGVGDLRKTINRLYPEKIYDCDEYNTSQICYYCDSKMNPMRRGRLSQLKLFNQLKNGKDVNYRNNVHGLRQCQTCRKTWNRDVNASLNMARILYNNLRDQDRPLALHRPQNNEANHLLLEEDTIASGT